MDGWTFPGRLLVLAVLLLSSSCASLPEDRGFSEVRQWVSERSGQALLEAPDAESQQWIAGRLTAELSSDDAVRIALLQNPRLRAEYARLGFAAADVYQAGRLSNPRLSASALFPDGAGQAQVGLGFVQSFTDLLLLSSRSRFAQAQFARTQQLVGSAALDLAAEVQAAYYRAAGAQQIAVMRQSILTAAQASADLAQRFLDAGNITQLALAMEQAAASQARLEAMSASADSFAARSELNGLLGLAANQNQWTLPAGLPAPFADEDEVAALIALAYKSRLDYAAAQTEAELMANALGVTRRYRYVGGIEAGVETEKETDGSRITGPTLGIELPIFNQGADRVARAQAQLQQAESGLKSLELEISNAVTLAHAKVQAARGQIGQYRTALVPQRETIVRRTLEEVTYMFKGQFELLQAKQQEYDSYQGYLRAVRDYWLARVELAHAVGANLPSSKQASGETVAPMVPQEPPAAMHNMHEGMPMDDMKGMDMPMEDMPGMNGMDHSGHGTAKPEAAPGKKAAPSMPPPRKGEGPAEMPTGMESHIPEPAGKPVPKSNKSETPQHGDHK